MQLLNQSLTNNLFLGLRKGYYFANILLIHIYNNSESAKVSPRLIVLIVLLFFHSKFIFNRSNNSWRNHSDKGITWFSMIDIPRHILWLSQQASRLSLGFVWRAKVPLIDYWLLRSLFDLKGISKRHRFFQRRPSS